MGEKKQPGCRVDEELYERFVQWAKQKSGRERGIAGRELEKAMRDRMKADNGPDELARIENDVAHIKAMLAEGTDGGEVSPTLSESVSTRARRTEKPAANQPRQKKIQYLIDRLISENPVERESGVVPKKVLRDVVTDEYNFDSNIVDEYIDNTPPYVDVIVDGGIDSAVSDAIEFSRPAGIRHNLVRPQSIQLAYQIDLRGTDISTSAVNTQLTDFLLDSGISENIYSDEVIE